MENILNKKKEKKNYIFALVLSCLLFLPLVNKISENKGIEIKISVEGQLKPLNYKLFYTEEEEEEFSEKKSLEKTVKENFKVNEILFFLNQDKLKDVRIDLGENFETLTVKKIIISGKGKTVLTPEKIIKLRMNGIEDKKIENGGLYLKSNKGDPFIILGRNVESKKKPDKIKGIIVFGSIYFFLLKLLQYAEKKKINFSLYSEIDWKYKGIYLILLLLPVSILAGGNFFKEIFMPGIYMFTIIVIYKNGIKKCFYEKYMIIFIISVLVSIIFSNYDRGNGVKKLINDLSWLLLPSIFGQFKLELKDFKLLLISTYAGVSILFFRYLKEIQTAARQILGIDIDIFDIFTYKGWKLIIQMSEKMWRLGISSPFKYIGYNATIISIIIIVLMVYIFYEKNIKWRAFAIVFLIPSYFFLILTQSRASYLGLVIFFLYLIYKKILNLKLKLKIGIVTFLILLLTFFRNTPFGRRAEAIGAIDTSSLGRIEVYKESFRIFKENIFTGVGYENFKNAQITEGYKIHEKYQHSHNMGLKLLSETGIIGFIGYFLMMLFLMKNFFSKRGEFRGLLGLVITGFLLIVENFDVLVRDYKLYAFIFIYIGYSMNIFYDDNKRAKRA